MDNTAVLWYVRVQMVIVICYFAVGQNIHMHGNTQKCDERGV